MRVLGVKMIPAYSPQAGELDASKGGTAAMDIGFITKRGTNKFHGQLYEDYRSNALNANGWVNNDTRQHRTFLLENDFGGSVGGQSSRTSCSSSPVSPISVNPLAPQSLRRWLRPWRSPAFIPTFPPTPAPRKH